MKSKSSNISEDIAPPKSSGFWTRLGDVIEDMGLSYAERLERRVSLLEKEFRLLKQTSAEPGRPRE